MRSSATPTASMSRPSSSSDPRPSQTLDRADQFIPGLSSEPSWPTLRAHLLALAAETGEHPLLHLQTAASGRDLHTAGDMAAVLDWRLPELAPTDPGPLPWLPGIPPALHDHPVWGEYLAKRSQLVTGLADQVRDHASQARRSQPVWAPPGSHPTAALIGEIAVWRAAVGIDPRDRRPTGPGQLQIASALWQQHLDRRITHPGDDPVSLDPRRGQVGPRIPKTASGKTDIPHGDPRPVQHRHRHGLAEKGHRRRSRETLL